MTRKELRRLPLVLVTRAPVMTLLLILVALGEWAERVGDRISPHLPAIDR